MCLDDYRQLAKALKTPPMFTDVLSMIVKPDEVDLLLKLSESKRSIGELSRLLSLSQKTVESKVTSLFARGFLKKKRNGKVYYSTMPFQTIVDSYLSEGRAGSLGKYVAVLATNRLEEHVKRGRATPLPPRQVAARSRGRS